MKHIQKATLLAAISLLIAALGKADADVQTTTPIGNQSSLDGWGPYKFGMTADQVQSFDGPKWLMLPKPKWAQWPDFSFSLSTRDVDQFGLHHITVIEEFDAEEHLSSIHLDYHRGGLTPENCKEQFESLLTKLETQYGAFGPGDDDWSGTLALSKSDVSQNLPGGKSQYRDIVRENIQDARYSANEKLLRATAKRVDGDHSVAVQMEVAENQRLNFPGQDIPANVLALAPNLARPICALQVVFRSKIPITQAALPTQPSTPVQQPSSPASPGSTVADQFHNLRSTITSGAPPSQLAAATNSFIEAAKRDGLMGPMDPVLDAYIRARVMYDEEDEAALLAKMNAEQTAQAAYIRHDYPLAIKLWTPLAKKGNAEAAASVGTLYEYGLNGVQKDYAEAFKWRKLAASEGDNGSQETLGEDYAEGQGVPRDNVRAYMWYTVSLERAGDGAWKNWFPATITKHRDTIAAVMSPAEIARSKSMAARCVATHYKKCG